jgi:hypothetical protein
MKITFKNATILTISIVLLFAFAYSLFFDLNFFLTKKEAGIKNMRVVLTKQQNPYVISIEYYNSFLNETVECTPNISIHDAEILSENYSTNKNIFISYAKFYPKRIYIKDVNEPRVWIVLFDIIMVLLMFFSVYAFSKPLFEKFNKPKPI